MTACEAEMQANTLCPLRGCLSDRYLPGSHKYTHCTLCQLSELLMLLCVWWAGFLGTVRGGADCVLCTLCALWRRFVLLLDLPDHPHLAESRCRRVWMLLSVEAVFKWYLLNSGLKVCVWSAVGSRTWCWKHELNDQNPCITSHFCCWLPAWPKVPSVWNSCCLWQSQKPLNEKFYLQDLCFPFLMSADGEEWVQEGKFLVWTFNAKPLQCPISPSLSQFKKKHTLEVLNQILHAGEGRWSPHVVHGR